MATCDGRWRPRYLRRPCRTVVRRFRCVGRQPPVDGRSEVERHALPDANMPSCSATRADHVWHWPGVHVQCQLCSLVPCCSQANRGKGLASKRKRPMMTKLALRDGDRCYWCGIGLVLTTSQSSDSVTLDHVVPRRQGGASVEGNLVLACYRCNHLRGDMPADEWERSPRLHLRRCSVWGQELRSQGFDPKGRGYLHVGTFLHVSDDRYRCPTCGAEGYGWKAGDGLPQIQDVPCVVNAY